MKRPSPQNMNARLEYGAAASSMVRTKGIMYGQNETASVPNADRKIDMTIGKGSSSRRYRTLIASTMAASAPITGEDEQIRTLRPSAHHLQICGQRVDKNDNKEYK